MNKSEIQRIYALSPMQEGMLYHSIMNEDSNTYFEQFSFNIEGEIDVQLFEKSFNILIERYDILRTVFIYEKISSPRQVVLNKRHADLYFTDLTSLPEKEKSLSIEKYKLEDREKGFNLAKDILIRMAILKVSNNSYRLIWSFHHILIDGWCLGIILKELFQVYNFFKSNKPICLNKVVQYSDYIKWLEKKDKEEAFSFWNETLFDYEQQATIPKSCNFMDGKYKQEEISFTFEEDLVEALSDLAKSKQVTLNTVIKTMWGILLQTYNNTNDVVFGSVVSGRTPEIPGIEDIVGLFINTIPLRVKSEENDTFSGLSKKVQDFALVSEKYSYLPLAKIQSNTRMKQNLIDHIVVFENYPVEKEINELIYGQGSYGFTVHDIEEFEQTSYDFNVIIIPGKKLVFRFNYNAKVYQRVFVKRIGVHLERIAESIISNPDIPINELDILSNEEKKQILQEFNDTNSPYSNDKTIHEMFEEQVEKTPKNIAVVFNGNSLNYEELNNKSNQLARMLREKGVVADTLVALMLERSIDIIVGILGIIKAGGAILPIDPDYPAERIKYMLEDSKANILLTQGRLTNKVDFLNETIDIEDRNIYKTNFNNLEKNSKAEDLLYVIYTSGSTGKPKGVMIEHRNIVNLINFEYEKTGIDFSEKVLQFTTISFDVCYQEIFSTLLCGGELHVINNEIRKNVTELFNYIENNQISVVSLPTSLLKFISNEAEYIRVFPKRIRHLITAGEQLIISNIFKMYLKSNDLVLHNHYGPSETHVVTTYTIDSKNDITEIPPIGSPISNTKVYILSNNKKLQPIGVVGELYISGDCVGRGYFKRDELTEEKFSQDLYFNGKRMYKTGDLARWLDDGNIEFLGRADYQVKIRGFRIELGEIENQLLRIPVVKEAVVIARKDSNGNNKLYAYLVSTEEIPDLILKEHLLKELPDYMVPSHFLCLSKMPKTPNGKIDRNALPEFDESNDFTNTYLAPSNDVEVKLVEMWEKALGISKVGVNDNFFQLGGDSLTIMRAVAGTYTYNWGLTIQDFYKYQNIKELSGKIMGIKSKKGNNEKINADIAVRNVRQEIGDVSIGKERAIIENVFLTGATGFLGAHILNDLLQTTQASIYCLVRAENQAKAENRLFELLNFYFSDKYFGLLGKRIFVINGEITLERMGLSNNIYSQLAERISIVIHAAALVKRYGDYSEFEKVNIKGTKEIIVFSTFNKKKLNYISTVGVSGNNLEQKVENLRMTENDFFIGQNYEDNVYLKSKFEAENLIFKAMDAGLNATVFRVGNLTGRYTDGHFQANINENAFYNLLKSLIEVKIIPDKLLEQYLEFTPVDFCSRAVVELLKFKEADGRVFHLINHKVVNIREVFINFLGNLGIKFNIFENCSLKDYTNCLSKYSNSQDAIGFINNEVNTENVFSKTRRVFVDSKLTIEYLRQINFEWPEIDAEYIEKLINYMKKDGFLKYKE